MTVGSWVLGQRREQHDLGPGVAELLQALVDCTDRERAVQVSSLVELRVAPPRGGLGQGADHVLSVLVAHLPLMSAAARPEAVSLMGHIGYSMSLAGGRWPEEGRRRQATALPVVAATAQYGDDDLRAEFVDFAAWCAEADPALAPEVSFYLQRLVEAGGQVGVAAEVELTKLSDGGAASSPDPARR